MAVSVRHVDKNYRIVDPEGPTNLREAMVRRLRHPLSDNVGNEVFPALADINLDVYRGEIFGLIGHNGAGKSTLLKVITRITEIDAGEVDVYGRVGSLIEVGTGFHPDLTGRENVFLNGAILGMTRVEIARKFDTIIDFAEIGEFTETPVKRYSTGMAVRLAFSVAAHLDAEILLIDEVLAVGDAGFQSKCMEKIDEIAASGERTIFLVSHNMANIRRACNRAAVLTGGHITFVGAPEEATRRYLGAARSDRTVGGSAFFENRQEQPHIEKVEVLGPDGFTTSTVESGQPMQLIIGIRDLDEITRPTVGVRIASRSDLSIATFVANAQIVESVTASGSVEIVLSIPDLPLAPDRYWVDVSVLSLDKHHQADVVLRATWFDVSSRHGGLGHYQMLHGDGVVMIPASWEPRSVGP
jgi:lipopolysaccharide transport system ATP-binding protein